jgi:hypothetical protein
VKKKNKSTGFINVIVGKPTSEKEINMEKNFWTIDDIVETHVDKDSEWYKKVEQSFNEYKEQNQKHDLMMFPHIFKIAKKSMGLYLEPLSPQELEELKK